MASEDSCPVGNKCAEIPMNDNTTQKYCLKVCNPQIGSNECDGEIACNLEAAIYFGESQAACLFSKCKTNTDCVVSTATACKVSEKNCPSGETCYRKFTDNDDGICHRPGKCDTKSGLCDKREDNFTTGAKVGAPCQSDLDCDANQQCEMEIDLTEIGKKKSGEACTQDTDCCSGKCGTDKTCAVGRPCVLNRNGYCWISGCNFKDTLTHKACPTGSECDVRFLLGYCMKTCELAKADTCRGNANDYYGDYECREWKNIGVPIQQPLCDFGYMTPCSFFKGSDYDCSKLSSDMACQTVYNQPLSDKYDSSGYCFDSTASGPVRDENTK
jgi:hypothetical protein